ncbi:hypothetical protein ACTL4S_07915 [Acinetobacter lwoffii]|uniref:hypothetical protein n=1 Tax=Acinetobacter lwoffii TaxID=28090 RepID=UPI003F8D6163
MNQSAVITVVGDNSGIRNLTLINSGDPNATAVIIKGNNFRSENITLENFSIGYFSENQSDISINHNLFLLPTNKSIPIVRAVLFTNCKSIKIKNNTVIFESVINFQKIKNARQVTIKSSEYRILQSLIQKKFSHVSFWKFLF